MQKHREIPWPRIVAEGAAIVISILLAFGIQAWWDAVVEQDREREILTALSDDFNQTRTNLIDGINFHTAVQDRNQKLLAAITGSK